MDPPQPEARPPRHRPLRRPHGHARQPLRRPRRQLDPQQAGHGEGSLPRDGRLTSPQVILGQAEGATREPATRPKKAAALSSLRPKGGGGGSLASASETVGAAAGPTSNHTPHLPRASRPSL